MSTSAALCRICDAELNRVFVDLGVSPLCESFLEAAQCNEMEPFYPLCAYVCEQCFLVQLQAYVDPGEIFSEYAYFSSYSDSWLRHAKDYVAMAAERFDLDANSRVVEVASNDGYLLQYFVERGVPVLGIEPAANVAKVAVERGVTTEVRFFGQETAHDLAQRGRKADLLIGNNVLAQVPDLRDFVRGMKILLEPRGVITLEFPHLLRLMTENQYDTIYHEHFSYFSLYTLERFFAKEGLTIFDVEELKSHGGSLRIFAKHSQDESKPIGAGVAKVASDEQVAGLDDTRAYESFAEQVRETKRALLEFLIKAKRAGKTVVGYGAPGKGNTLLNYCGIRSDFLDYTVDRNPYKHGRFTPGTHIPIFPPERIRETKPDYVLILPWNLRNEIIEQESYIREWGGRFVVPIPTVEVIP